MPIKELHGGGGKGGEVQVDQAEGGGEGGRVGSRVEGGDQHLQGPPGQADLSAQGGGTGLAEDGGRGKGLGGKAEDHLLPHHGLPLNRLLRGGGYLQHLLAHRTAINKDLGGG